MSKDLVRSGLRMDEALAKLRAARPAPSSPSFSPPRLSTSASPCSAPPVFLEWAMCAMDDRPFYTRIERQPSGLYLRVECVRASAGGSYAGLSDSRVLRLDQIRGHIGPCPWCGDDRGQFECNCGLVCGGRVDQRRKWFRCRDSCGEVWRIGDEATETQVSEEARAGQWKKTRDAGIWKAPAPCDPARLLLPPAKGRR